MILTKELAYEHFDYATSAREMTWEFIDGEISSKEWLKGLYHPPAKKFAKALIRDSGGVKKTRIRLKRMFKKLYGWS